MPTRTDLPVKFNPDGTVTCSVAGARHRLRRPTMAEMRELRELWNEALEDVDDRNAADFTETSTQLEADLAAAREAGERDEVKRLRAEKRKLRKASNEMVEELLSGWVREVFATVDRDGGLPDPEGDDPAEGLEPWLVTSFDFGTRLFHHWMTVPFDSGDEMVQAAKSLLSLNGTAS